MSRLMMTLLARCMAPAGDDGADTGGTDTAPSAALLAEHGLTAEEFAELDERDRANLLADTPDDTEGVEEPNKGDAASPLKPAATTPPAKTEGATDEGADPDEEDVAAATAAAATAAAAAPAAAAVTPPPVIETPWDDMPEAAIVLPKIPEPPRWTPVATPELIAKRDEVQGKLDELEQKFEEGEITREEWVAQRKPLQTDLRTYELDITTDEVNQRNTQRAAAARFETYVDTSMAQAKAAGLDYFAADNKPKLQELDAALKRFAQASVLMHPGKSADWRDRWALNQAHVEVAGKYGVDLAKAAPAPTAKTTAKPAAAPATGRRPAADLTHVPPTIRNAPAAADAQVEAGEFAHLDGLGSLELEKAVARMTPEQQARYLDV
jgi:hypothetical protein